MKSNRFLLGMVVVAALSLGSIITACDKCMECFFGVTAVQPIGQNQQPNQPAGQGPQPQQMPNPAPQNNNLVPNNNNPVPHGVSGVAPIVQHGDNNAVYTGNVTIHQVTPPRNASPSERGGTSMVDVQRRQQADLNAMADASQYDASQYDDYVPAIFTRAIREMENALSILQVMEKMAPRSPREHAHPNSPVSNNNRSATAGSVMPDAVEMEIDMSRIQHLAANIQNRQNRLARAANGELSPRAQALLRAQQQQTEPTPSLSRSPDNAPGVPMDAGDRKSSEKKEDQK